MRRILYIDDEVSEYYFLSKKTKHLDIDITWISRIFYAETVCDIVNPELVICDFMGTSVISQESDKLKRLDVSVIMTSGVAPPENMLPCGVIFINKSSLAEYLEQWVKVSTTNG